MANPLSNRLTRWSLGALGTVILAAALAYVWRAQATREILWTIETAHGLYTYACTDVGIADIDQASAQLAGYWSDLPVQLGRPPPLASIRDSLGNCADRVSRPAVAGVDGVDMRHLSLALDTAVADVTVREWYAHGEDRVNRSSWAPWFRIKLVRAQNRWRITSWSQRWPCRGEWPCGP